MSYEIIEKNKYGVLVKNTTTIIDCKCCKYIHKCCGYCYYKSYYLTDKEAAKLETELTPETFTINDMYVESKLLFDCPDELKSLQLENDQVKERIKELEQTIENMKAIAGEKVEPINVVSSVDYTTELITEMDDVYGINIPIEITRTKCCNISVNNDINFCPNCGRKIMR